MIKMQQNKTRTFLQQKQDRLTLAAFIHERVEANYTFQMLQ